jgi:putative ABC transport system permease protein
MSDPSTTSGSPRAESRGDWVAELRARLSSLRLSPAREAEIIEELSQHLDDRRQELIAGGATLEEASRLMLDEFHADRLARYLAPLRQSRTAEIAPPGSGRFLLGGVITDLRHAVRELRAAPEFTIVALAVLMLGIGASTAIFSVVDAVVLRGLPFDEHDRLVAVGERRPRGPRDTNYDPQAVTSIATPNYLDWIAEQQVFESIAAVIGQSFNSFTLKEPGAEPEDLPATRVTAGFFDVLRIRPALGRPFTAENEVDGRHRVVVLSDGLWRRRFGGNPDIVGRTIAFDDGAYEVLGVMPPGASLDVAYTGGTLRPTEILVPYVITQRDRFRDPGGREMITRSIARLKPGVSVEQAQAQMDQIAAALEKAHPEWNRDNKAGVRPLRDHIVGTSTKSWMLMLLGAVGIVLLIACANVANLQLARASAREREVAVRAALGAGRLRLIRLLMIESLVLAIAGTALALPVAWWAIEVLRTSMPDGVARVAGIALNLRVFAAASGLSVLTALVFGIVPALQVSRPDLTNALKDGTRGASAGRGRLRLRSALVVVEVALAVMLLVGAALFIGSAIALMRIEPGFGTERVLTAQISPRMPPGSRPSEAVVALADVIERVSAAPGVVHASLIYGGLPLGRGNWTTNISITGKQIEDTDRFINARIVTPNYHKALRIPLRSGRLFEATDRIGAEPVVIINESAARKYFPGEDPIGRSVNISREDRTIVGVVGDVHQASLETDPRAEGYVPLAQVSNLRGGSDLVILTSVDPYDVLPAVKAAVSNGLPGVPVRNVTTMDELLARRIAHRRLNMLLLGLFGLLGLVISAVGLYGVMAYGVSQRTREIGVRMALGATRSNVVGMVLTNACVLVAVGLILGAAGAWYLSATARAFLFGLEPTDPRAFAAALVSLSLAGAIASIIPARRASSVDPVVALRAE